MKKVMVFGVFDGVHEGHRALFRQAREYGDRLTVAVAPDDIVTQLKGAPPRLPLAERVKMVQQEPLVDEAVAGDATLGEYEVVVEHQPDAVVLGYDQEELKDDLTKKAAAARWGLTIIVADPYEPDRYHNSILGK